MYWFSKKKLILKLLLYKKGPQQKLPFEEKLLNSTVFNFSDSSEFVIEKTTFKNTTNMLMKLYVIFFFLQSPITKEASLYSKLRYSRPPQYTKQRSIGFREPRAQ